MHNQLTARDIIKRFIESENITQLAFDYNGARAQHDSEMKRLSDLISEFVMQDRWNVPKLRRDLENYLRRLERGDAAPFYRD